MYTLGCRRVGFKTHDVHVPWQTIRATNCDCRTCPCQQEGGSARWHAVKYTVAFHQAKLLQQLILLLLHTCTCTVHVNNVLCL